MFVADVDDSTSSSKLSNVEAQRIMSVLSEIQKKVLFIGCLPDIDSDRKTSVIATTVFTPDVVTQLNVTKMIMEEDGIVIELNFLL